MSMIITTARADILDYLKGYPGTVTEVAQALGIPRANVNERISWLNSAGLLRCTGHGERTQGGGGPAPRAYQTSNTGVALMNMIYAMPKKRRYLVINDEVLALAVAGQITQALWRSRSLRAPKGFAMMDSKKVSAIASKGGITGHALGVAHEFTKQEAKEAGRKGGLANRRSAA